MAIALAQTKLRPHWLQCPDCKGYFDPNNDPYATVEDGFDEKTICVNCVELSGEVICDDCGDLIGSDESVDETFFQRRWGRNGYTEQIRIHRCEECAEEAGWAKCEGCSEWVEPDEVITFPGNDSYCEECFCEHYSYCSECGDVFDNNEIVACAAELYCRSCAPNSKDFEPGGFKRRTGCTTKTGSERCYGVELETDGCNDYYELEGSGAWGAKNDDTISGKEFYSAILDGDDGLKAVADLADLAEMNDWRVANDCGFHLHLDARNESDDALFAAAYAYRATQELWNSFVDPDRCNNQYSHKARWTLADLDYSAGSAGSFDRFITNNTSSRYEWMNLRAYTTHTTFEVRLHHASVDGEEICNWIKAHTRFMDWATTTGYDGVKEALDGMDYADLFNFIVKEVWQDDELCAYYGKKSALVACAV